MNRFKELADFCDGYRNNPEVREIESILRALAAADEALPRCHCFFDPGIMAEADDGDYVKRDDALKAVALASKREVE